MNPGSIAVIGAGSAGLALVADLTRRRFEVGALIDRDPGVVDTLGRLPAVKLTGHLGAAMLPMPLVTTDFAAIEGCRYILVATTADAHRQVARDLAPWVDASHTVLLVTGYVGGSRIVQDALGSGRPAGSSQIRVLELNSSPHLSCTARPGEVHIAAVKGWVEVTSPCPALTAQEAPGLAALLPQLAPGDHALASSLNNPNPVAHVPAYLSNVAHAHSEVPVSELAARGGAFYLSDFAGADVERLRVLLEAERVRVMQALGLSRWIVGRADFAARAYPDGSRETRPPRMGRTFPRRLVAEDVPCGLVPLESLARTVDVEVPVATALITLAGAVEGRDWRALGRTAAEVLPPGGLEGPTTQMTPPGRKCETRSRTSGVAT